MSTMTWTYNPSWGDTDAGGFYNVPCGHYASFKSVCPSWSPVDGCLCMEHLGGVTHGRPTMPAGFPDPPDPTW